MNRITDILGIKYPIIQAPMSWVTSAELVAAVSNAGGMGTLGPNAGHHTVANGPEDSAERLRTEIRKTKALTDKPFGVNYFPPAVDAGANPYGEAQLKVLMEEEVQVLVVVGEANEKDMKRLKGLGFTVVFRELHPTVMGAKKAEGAGADIIVATGFDEGGSTPDIPVGTMTVVPMIVDAVKIPVMATGGITDKRGVNAAFALGAEGVYLGTRFIASVESPAHENAKQDIVKHGTEDLVLLRTGYGGYWRATPHSAALEAHKLKDHEVDSTYSRIGNLKTAMLDGQLEEGINTVSSGIQFIQEITTCEEIINELMADYILKNIQ
ncbi:nitronate monooxygenase [Paenibacillus tritici]|uniref:Probable nitronate monooxygenase n=1 Tax=Paenibacillus tritici TaxID=1873425 RepID=A0ABX2DI63_9BACL|nr:nitronate monooxygenase [Paenibacillus tritici]NQX43759.1 nitronate monooxygenase [Paenibacillus tritici]